MLAIKREPPLFDGWLNSILDEWLNMDHKGAETPSMPTMYLCQAQKGENSIPTINKGILSSQHLVCVPRIKTGISNPQRLVGIDRDLNVSFFKANT
jgi:hypothetical protein